MFVFSLKANRTRIIALLLFAIIIFAMLYFTRDKETPVVDGDGINLKASDEKERIAFLSQFGWKIDEEPTAVEEIIIPSQFDEVYEKYNQLQRSQNLDLEKYAGKTAKKWTYTVKNYPGYESDNSCIRANIIVYDGAVIGGDISSLEQGGFTAGFDFPKQASE